MTTNKPEPVAWQYRWRAVRDDGTLGDWNEWQPGRAPKMRTNVYQHQERALYAHPSPADEAVRRDAERYRWLKQHAFCGVWHRGDGLALVAPRVIQREVDAAIDAALAQEQENKA